jgi:hypothetical protein
MNVIGKEGGRNHPDRVVVVRCGHCSADLEYRMDGSLFTCDEVVHQEGLGDSQHGTLGACPLCLTPVKTQIKTDHWEAFDEDEKLEETGPSYEAKCEKCGAALISMPTQAEVDAGRYLWYASGE